MVLYGIRLVGQEKCMNASKAALSCLLGVFALLLGSCETFSTSPAAAMPSIAPPPGTYPPDVLVARLSCTTTGAVIHYTTDGSTPTTESPTYGREGIPVAVSTAVRAIAVAPEMRPSRALRAAYTVSDRGGTIHGTLYSDDAHTVPLRGVPAGRFTIAQVQSVDKNGTPSIFDSSKLLFYYDRESGAYAMTGLPPDAGAWIIAYVKNTTGTPGAHPGDLFFDLTVDASTMSAKARNGIDMHPLGILHMTSPLDNAHAVPKQDPDSGNVPAHASPVRFAWDAYPGASYYKLWLTEMDRGWIFIRSVANGVIVAGTDATYSLPPSKSPGGYYVLNIRAFDAHDVSIARGIFSSEDGYPNLNDIFVVR
jgi:hypothetical protein